MRGVRTLLATAALGLALVACGSSGAQVGSIESGENPPAEAAAATTESQKEIAEKRSQERSDDPRTEEEQREADAREAAEDLKDVAGDVKKGLTEAHFTMPRLTGRSLQDAQDELQSRGSYLLDQVDATSQKRFQLMDSNWKVCHQAPAPGAYVLKTRLVRLEAVKLEEKCP